MLDIRNAPRAKAAAIHLIGMLPIGSISLDVAACRDEARPVVVTRPHALRAH